MKISLMSNTMKLILYYASIVVCTILEFLTLLSLFSMDRVVMPILFIALLGNALIAFFELLLSFLFIYSINNNKGWALSSFFGNIILYCEIEVSITFLCIFIYGIIQYMPQGLGSDVFLYSTIFILLNVYRTLLIYSSTYCTIYNYLFLTNVYYPDSSEICKLKFKIIKTNE